MNRDTEAEAAMPRTQAWIALAGTALAAGVAVYAWARPQAAAFLPSAWHRPIGWWPSNPLSAALPTFLHALALPLLIAALLRPARVETLRAVCAAWCAVELLFESMQHRAIGGLLLAHMPSQTPWAELSQPLVAFVRRGTFDPLDVVAALLASALACAILCRPIHRHALNRETRHV